ncbi:MAG: hypothetical protein ACD_6C00498G0001 [uncultured bacterium]|nr:MAG: hypothetical protein ACD_6C00498G0001 [uncultured bacterium]
MNLLYRLLAQKDKSYYVPAHHQTRSPLPVSHQYGYPGPRPKWYVHQQVQTAVNDAGFQQRHSSLLFQQPDVFQSAMNVQSLDELYRARTILQFASRNPDELVAEQFQDCIQFQYAPMEHHLRHQLSGLKRFPDGHAASPINDVKALCSSFQRNRNNHGIFYRLLFSHHLQLNFSARQFLQMSL